MGTSLYSLLSGGKYSANLQELPNDVFGHFTNSNASRKNPKYFPDLFVNHCYSVSFRRVTGLVKTEIYIRIIYCFKDI